MTNSLQVHEGGEAVQRQHGPDHQPPLQVTNIFWNIENIFFNPFYSNDGMNIISSSADDQIIIYDCEKGTQKFSLNSKKYGVDLIHFTQNKNHAVHASTKENDIIRSV